MDDVTTPTAPMSAHEAATAAFADSSSAAPETSTPAVDTSASAIATPAATETAPDSVSTETPPPANEPPKWRWQDILENTRKKVAEETETRLKQELSWATAIPEDQRAQIPTALQLVQALNSNPQGTIEALQRYLGLTANGQATPSSGRPQPDVDAGNGTFLYSAPQQEKLLAWERQQWLNEVNQRLAPVEQDRQHRLMEQHQQAIVQNAQQTLSRMRERPHFRDHEPEIRDLMVADKTLSLEDAYVQVLLEKVIPSMEKKSESNVLAQLQTRAVQATVNPSSAVPSAPGSLIGNARAAAEAAFREA